MRWGQWPILYLFWVRGWPYRSKDGDHVLTFFPMFPVIFCIFSLRCDHDLSLFYCPYSSTFLIFYYKKSTTQHTTYTLTDTHIHAHLPLTVILRVVWVRVTRGKTRENAWKRQSQGNLWRRLVIVRLRRSDDRPIEPSGSWFPPKFPSFSRKKAND